MIKLENINKKYKVGGEDFYALKDVSLEIKDGEFVSVCGASGSGKTTLLNIIGCLDDASSGGYYLSKTPYAVSRNEEAPDGVKNTDLIDVFGLSGAKKARLRNEYFGFVLQDFALINSQTVIYNAMLPLLYSKVPYGKIKGLAMDALESVGLEDQARKKANQLSGGQRQRIAIARALVNAPYVILADEPTGQLDSETGMQIMNMLKDINGSGVTVIVVTHDPKVAAMADRTITMADGMVK